VDKGLIPIVAPYAFVNRRRKRMRYVWTSFATSPPPDITATVYGDDIPPPHPKGDPNNGTATENGTAMNATETNVTVNN
jgi:hypothetical protein